MSFVQVIDCKTRRVEELNRLMDDWSAATQGKRTATHSLVGKDRDDPSHVVEIVEFPSYDEAMRNSKLPETERIYQEMVALCEAPPQFTNLDVVRDEQLNKDAARRFFDCISRGDLDACVSMLTSDYRDYDPANEGRVQDAAAFRDTSAMYVDAIDPSFTVVDQIAEGDRVTTRWTISGRHRGEFKGVRPTGSDVTIEGQTTQRFREGEIYEAHWNWDQHGLLRQLGVLAA